MIKLICDRCGKEIDGDKYYTINIFSNDIYPTYNNITNAVYTQSSCLNSRESILEMFNRTKIYCKNCRDKIEKIVTGI